MKGLSLSSSREGGLEREREREKERKGERERDLAAGLGALGVDLGALGTIGAICELGSGQTSLFLRDLRARNDTGQLNIRVRRLKPQS